MTWDDALRTRLLEPLGLSATATLPEDIMVHPHAVGHEPRGATSLELQPVKRWLDARGSGPCGGTLATTAADLLTFAAMHMADGVTRDGRRVLSSESARAMREPRVVQPDPAHSPAWGWGWAIERLDGPRVVEHGGNTCGQESQLLAVPEAGVAIAVLTNGDAQGLLRKQLVDGLVRDLLEVSRPDNPPASATPVDVEPFVGSFYRTDDLRIDVVSTDGAGLAGHFITSGDVAEMLPSFTTPLVYAGGTTFLLTLPPMTEQITATFVREDDELGPASHLAIGLRAAPRL
jgi:hypothetical protein